MICLSRVLTIFLLGISIFVGGCSSLPSTEPSITQESDNTSNTPGNLSPRIMGSNSGDEGDSCDYGEVSRVGENTTATDLENILDDSMALVIIVPGTNAEDGCVKQFTSIIDHFSESSGTAIISLDYLIDESEFLLSTEHWNAAHYDASVIHGVDLLKDIIDILKGIDIDDVRVYGHSKGSHIVARTSIDYVDDAQFRFWAFAQPLRTSLYPAGYEAPLGRYGYIDKPAPNLVTATWLNDEVQYYSSINAVSGLTIDWVNPEKLMPRAFKYPGYVNDAGEPPFDLDINRIDHHNTYGGDYEEETCPYYATGDDSLYNDNTEDNDQDTKGKLFCDVKKESFQAYFWGDQACRDLAEALMTDNGFSAGNASVRHHYIGPSGPRGESCQPAQEVDVDLEIKYILKGKNNNKVKFAVYFLAYDEDGDGKGSRIDTFGPFGREAVTEVVYEEDDNWLQTAWKWGKKTWREIDKKSEKRQIAWQKETETLSLPYSFVVRLDPYRYDVNEDRDNTIHIAWLKATFDDPHSDRRLTRYIIGPQKYWDALTPFEGQDELGNLAGSPHAGWQKYPDDTDWKLYKSTNTAINGILESLKLKGGGNEATDGFYKYYSLID